MILDSLKNIGETGLVALLGAFAFGSEIIGILF